ncbi:hypothetical protein RFI_28661 [Reticulomyxa filosa]|uniref:Uncharacterized protein n=1 Tax=Reticulomyxa filosa TaxID=46433 RepID=X6M515_RETFI|nr:hypothetical protein RFI_28661 [Reticulomyxa filosa]|eukprot:ETO08726.1 hypothetical protein RFI_28661 [Reticulomyxa filosa]
MLYKQHYCWQNKELFNSLFFCFIFFNSKKDFYLFVCPIYNYELFCQFNYDNLKKKIKRSLLFTILFGCTWQKKNEYISFVENIFYFQKKKKKKVIVIKTGNSECKHKQCSQ